MYLHHFGLARQPFSIAPDPDLLYLTPAHDEALAHLHYALSSHGGLVCLTGEVGMGKTTLCRAFIDQVSADVDVAYIFNPILSPSELLQSICDELSIERGATDSNKQLVDALYHDLIRRYAEGRKVICIIDEAQSMPTPLLEQIRLLTNLETRQDKLLTLILVGQSELQDTLQRFDLRQLEQRITARFHLRGMPKEQMKAYVNHRLSQVGCQRMLFSDRSLTFIWQAAQGIPRRINSIADRSLLGAYAQGRERVDVDIARRAVREVMGEGGQGRGEGRKKRRGVYIVPRFSVTSMISLLLLVALGALVSVSYRQQLMAWMLPEPVAQLAARQGVKANDCAEIARVSEYVCLDIGAASGELQALRRPYLVYDELAGAWRWPDEMSGFSALHSAKRVLLLWRPVTLGKGIHPGMSHKIIPWIKTQLLDDEVGLGWQIITPNQKNIMSAERFYDPLLAVKVAVFQRDSGLVVDRIIGVKTLLALRDAVREEQGVLPYGGAAKPELGVDAGTETDVEIEASPRAEVVDSQKVDDA